MQMLAIRNLKKNNPAAELKSQEVPDKLPKDEAAIIQERTAKADEDSTTPPKIESTISEVAKRESQDVLRGVNEHAESMRMLASARQDVLEQHGMTEIRIASNRTKAAHEGERQQKPPLHIERQLPSTVGVIEDDSLMSNEVLSEPQTFT